MLYKVITCTKVIEKCQYISSLFILSSYLHMYALNKFVFIHLFIYNKSINAYICITKTIFIGVLNLLE